MHILQIRCLIFSLNLPKRITWVSFHEIFTSVLSWNLYECPFMKSLRMWHIALAVLWLYWNPLLVSPLTLLGCSSQWIYCYWQHRHQGHSSTNATSHRHYKQFILFCHFFNNVFLSTAKRYEKGVGDFPYKISGLRRYKMLSLNYWKISVPWKKPS